MSRTEERLRRLDAALKQRLAANRRAFGADAEGAIAKCPLTATAAAGGAGLVVGLIVPTAVRSARRAGGVLGKGVRIALTSAAMGAVRGEAS